MVGLSNSWVVEIGTEKEVETNGIENGTKNRLLTRVKCRHELLLCTKSKVISLKMTLLAI